MLMKSIIFIRHTHGGFQNVDADHTYGVSPKKMYDCFVGTSQSGHDMEVTVKMKRPYGGFLDITNLYITNDFLDPSNSKIYEK